MLTDEQKKELEKRTDEILDLSDKLLPLEVFYPFY
jgi:hypothetical protein